MFNFLHFLAEEYGNCHTHIRYHRQVPGGRDQCFRGAGFIRSNKYNYSIVAHFGHFPARKVCVGSMRLVCVCTYLVQLYWHTHLIGNALSDFWAPMSTARRRSFLPGSSVESLFMVSIARSSAPRTTYEKRRHTHTRTVRSNINLFAIA